MSREEWLLVCQALALYDKEDLPKSDEANSLIIKISKYYLEMSPDVF